MLRHCRRTRASTTHGNDGALPANRTRPYFTQILSAFSAISSEAGGSINVSLIFPRTGCFSCRTEPKRQKPQSVTPKNDISSA